MMASQGSLFPMLPIHLIQKWRLINYSFVCMFISPLCLIFTSNFFCVFYMLTRHQGLINMETKEKFTGRHFGITCMTCTIVQRKARFFLPTSLTNEGNDAATGVQ